MDPDTINISYRFNLGAHGEERFDLQLDAQTLELIRPPKQDLPKWTDLSFHQCPHCPLDTNQHSTCPVAANISHAIWRFDKVVSYDDIDLEVTTDARLVSQRTSAQKAISSLLGLLFATSGCPHTNYMKPMARFHLPLATEEDTIFRAAGMYLLAQFYLKQEGVETDLELTGLTEIYNKLHIVNTSIAERIKSIAISDSSTNAVIILDTFTNIVPIVIEDRLDEIRHLFSAYLSDTKSQT
jgi:hypothetical protein